MRARTFEAHRPSVHSVGLRGIAALVGGTAMMQMLTGCILNAERLDLALDVPPAYRATRDRPHAAVPAPDWWRGFRSGELTALMEEAQAANFDIAAAIARIVQADAQARIAGAPLLPLLVGDADVTRSRSPNTSGAGSGRSRTVYTAALNASYEVDFWGKNRAALVAAEQTAVATRFDREVVALSVLASVANAYFQVLSSQDRIRIARNNFTAANRVLTLIRQRQQAGTASSLDVAQQESVVNTQRAAIPPLEQTLRQNIATLAVLIGKPPQRVTLRGGSMSRLAIPRVTPGLPSELLGQRPDIREAEALLAAAQANVVSARAAFFPSIRLTGDGGYASTALRTLFRPESAFYSVAAGLTQPIFDGYLLLGQLELQKGRREELVQLYRKAVISAFADVESALVAVLQTAQRERLQRDVVTSSRQAFDIAETRLREGTVDLVTVLNTQQTLFQAEDALAQARLARLQAVVSLFQALGGGWTVQQEAHAAKPDIAAKDRR
jgi:NodT family efflux transporter outer membrane factor (OMF) lipoprotein